MGPKAKNIIYFNYKQCLKTIFPSFSRKCLTTVPSDQPNAALNTLNCHKKSFTYRILFLTSSCRKPNILLNSAGLPGLKTNIFFVSAVLSSRGTKIVVPVGLFSTIFKIMHKNLSHPKQITYNCPLKIFSKYDSIRSFYRCDAKQFLMCLTLLCK